MKRMASAPPSFNPPPPTKRGRKEKGEEEELESLLPADIWNLILRWLGPKELLSCRATSTWLKIQVDGLDEVWERYHHSVLGSVRWKGASPQSLLQERRKDKKEESAKTTTTTTTTWFESYLNFHELFFSLQKKKKSDLSFDEQKLSRLAILNDSIPFVKCLKKLEMYSVDSDGPGRFDESKHLTLAIDEGFSDLACYLIVNDLFDDEEVFAARRFPCALHSAVCARNVQVAEKLLEIEADVQHEVDAELDFLSEACSNGDVEMVKLLLDHGASATGHDWLLCRPLHCCENIETLRLILEELDEENIDDWTESVPRNFPFKSATMVMMKAWEGEIGCVQLLLEKGARKGVKKAVELARKKGHSDIVGVLEKSLKERKKTRE